MYCLSKIIKVEAERTRRTPVPKSNADNFDFFSDDLWRLTHAIDADEDLGLYFYTQIGIASVHCAYDKPTKEYWQITKDYTKSKIKNLKDKIHFKYLVILRDGSRPMAIPLVRSLVTINLKTKPNTDNDKAIPMEIYVALSKFQKYHKYPFDLLIRCFYINGVPQQTPDIANAYRQASVLLQKFLKEFPESEDQAPNFLTNVDENFAPDANLAILRRLKTKIAKFCHPRKGSPVNDLRIFESLDEWKLPAELHWRLIIGDNDRETFEPPEYLTRQYRNADSITFHNVENLSFLNLKTFKSTRCHTISMRNISQESCYLAFEDLIRNIDCSLVKELSLTRCGLSHVPDFVYQFPNLEILSLDENFITEVSPKILLLKKLKRFQVNWNLYLTFITEKMLNNPDVVRFVLTPVHRFKTQAENIFLDERLQMEIAESFKADRDAMRPPDSVIFRLLEMKVPIQRCSWFESFQANNF